MSEIVCPVLQGTDLSGFSKGPGSSITICTLADVLMGTVRLYSILKISRQKMDLPGLVLHQRLRDSIRVLADTIICRRK